MVHLHYLFLLRLSVLKLDPKKRSTSTFTFLNPSLCGLLWWGKPIDKFLINLQSLSQQKWGDFTQPMLRYRHIRSECAHSGGLSKNSSQKAEYIPQRAIIRTVKIQPSLRRLSQPSKNLFGCRVVDSMPTYHELHQNVAWACPWL